MNALVMPLDHIQVDLSKLGFTDRLEALLVEYDSLLSQTAAVKPHLNVLQGTESLHGQISLHRVIRELESIARLYEINPRITHGTVTEEQLELLVRVMSGIKNYLVETETPIEVLKQRKLQPVAHARLTGYLQEKGLIPESDLVSIAGGDQPQLLIVDTDNHPRLDFNDAWLAWNLLSGGKYHPTREVGWRSRAVSNFDQALYLGGDEFRRDVSAFKQAVSVVLEDAFDQGTDLADEVRINYPRLAITRSIGEGLRLVEFRERPDRGFDATSFEPKGRHLSLSHILNRHQASEVHPTINPAGGNADFVEHGLRAHSLRQITGFETALASTKPRVAELRERYAEYFTGCIGGARDPTNRYNMFRWFFMDHYDNLRSGGQSYASYIKYAPRNMITGIDWMLSTLDELAATSEYFATIRDPIQAFKDSAIYAELKELVESDGKGEYLKYAGDFDSTKGSLTKRIMQISRKDPQAVIALEQALRRFEHLMTWADYYNACPVDAVVADIFPANRRLEIRDGRNLSLSLAYADPQRTVIPNDILFDEDQEAILITGANGEGKTSALEMIGTNLLLTHRLLLPLASSMTTPALGAMEYGVNLSVHGYFTSAHQAEALNIAQKLEVMSHRLPNERAVLLLDEFGKGTSEIDGISLILSVATYCQEHGIYFGGSTHFNDIADLDDVIKDLGLRVSFYTMEDHKLVRINRSVGRSGGIEVAESQGVHFDITHTAREVLDQYSQERITLSYRRRDEAVKREGFRVLSNQDLIELGLCTEEQSTSEWGSHRQVSYATRIFAQHSPYQVMQRDEELGKYVPFMRPDAAQAFMCLLTAELTEERRSARVKTIDTLMLGETPLYEEFQERISSLKDFMALFNAYQSKMDLERDLFSAMDVGFFAALVHQDRKNQYEQFVRVSRQMPIARAFEAIQGLGRLVSDYSLDACLEESAVVGGFFRSEAYSRLSAFVSSHEFLQNGEGELPFSEWQQWVNLCVDYKDELLQLNRAILDLSFYSTVASTVKHEAWISPNIGKDGTVYAKQAVNTALIYTPNDRAPIPVDVQFDDGNQYLTGTNMGGKTQTLELAGLLIYFNEQLGKVPAQEATIGRTSVLGVRLQSARSGEGCSTNQAEARRLKELFEEYNSLGRPANTTFLIDEPSRGTNSRDANPLNIGWNWVVQQHGGRTYQTTHYANLFGYLEKLDSDSRLQYQPWSLQLFSGGQMSTSCELLPEAERYKLYRGIGRSDGIKVAALMGFPSEIIERAEGIRERLQIRYHC